MLLRVVVFCLVMFTYMSSGLAAPKKWSYFEVGAQVKELINVSRADLSGVVFKGSWQFPKHYFVFGSFSTASSDFLDVGIWSDIDVEETTFGIGYRYPFSASSDLYFSVAHEDFEFISDAGKDTLDGFGLRSGIKTDFNQFLTANFYLAYKDFDAIDDVGGGVDATFQVTDNLYFKLSIERVAFTENRSISIGYKF